MNGPPAPAELAAIGLLLDGVDPELLSGQVNVMRLVLHPKGLAPRTANLGEWRSQALARLRRQIDLTADPGLIALLKELKSYATPPVPRRPRPCGARTTRGWLRPRTRRRPPG